MSQSNYPAGASASEYEEWSGFTKRRDDPDKGLEDDSPVED